MLDLRLVATLLVGSLAVVGSGLNAAERTVEVATVWSENVSNGERPDDILSGWRGDIDVAFQRGRSLPGGHRLQWGAGLRGELWPEYEGLNSLIPRVGGGWSYKPGLGAFRPVLSARTAGSGVLASERGRAGWAGSAVVGVDQRILPGLLVTLQHEWQRMDARARAFDRTSAEWGARLAWDVGAAWSLRLEVRRREGDVVSYSAPPRPDLEAIGKPITYVDTFEQNVPWIAYYFFAETDTVALTLGRIHESGRASTDLQVEERRTRHAGPGYRNRLLTLRTSFGF